MEIKLTKAQAEELANKAWVSMETPDHWDASWTAERYENLARRLMTHKSHNLFVIETRDELEYLIGEAENWFDIADFNAESFPEHIGEARSAANLVKKLRALQSSPCGRAA